MVDTYNFDLLIDRTKRHMAQYDPGHDWLHIERVRTLAGDIADEIEISRRLALESLVDRNLVDAASIIHDVADHKFVKGDRRASLFNVLIGVVPESDVSLLFEIWENISYSSGRVPETLEGQIVQDADRLDAIGNIGILRAAAYGSSVGRPLYNPNNWEDPGTTIGHFYEKLLKLKDTMNTQPGKIMAYRRTEKIRNFIIELQREIE